MHMQDVIFQPSARSISLFRSHPEQFLKERASLFLLEMTNAVHVPNDTMH